MNAVQNAAQNVVQNVLNVLRPIRSHILFYILRHILRRILFRILCRIAVPYSAPLSVPHSAPHSILHPVPHSALLFRILCRILRHVLRKTWRRIRASGRKGTRRVLEGLLPILVFSCNEITEIYTDIFVGVFPFSSSTIFWIVCIWFVLSWRYVMLIFHSPPRSPLFTAPPPPATARLGAQGGAGRALCGAVAFPITRPFFSSNSATENNQI